MKSNNEKQEKSLHLTKASIPEHVKSYFLKIFELKHSGEEFPVNLDDVWPLVYPRKDHAVRLLKESFIEGVHYQWFPKNGEPKVTDNKTFTNTGGDRRGLDYWLSVPCVEFFIASKRPEVFEVYRSVFHKAIEGTLHFGNKHFITRAEYCEIYGKSVNSFNGLLGNYPTEFLYAMGVWSISTDLCKLVEQKKGFEANKKKLRQKANGQLSIDFNKGGAL